jgi:tRNA/tmRNA/rRNA uracil-C5-methylase (TrmA/RlmC/RlmD family)
VLFYRGYIMSIKHKTFYPTPRGISEKDLDVLKSRYPSFEKEYSIHNGKVKTLGRMIEKRKDRIKQNQEEIKEYTEKLEDKEEIMKSLIKFHTPNIWLRKPKPSYPYWRGRVYWSIGKNVKPRVIEFHIISEKHRKELKLDEKGIIKLGVRNFREKLIRGDYGLYTR